MQLARMRGLAPLLLHLDQGSTQRHDRARRRGALQLSMQLQQCCRIGSRTDRVPGRPAIPTLACLTHCILIDDIDNRIRFEF